MVQIAREKYFEEFGTLPIEQKQATLFDWMNREKESITWEDFQEQWRSMTICAGCGHCVCYIPGCPDCNPF